MSSYKLTAVDSRGIAEPARLIFKVAGVDFEDVRMPRDCDKSAYPMRAIPVLEFDGYMFCQSNAIARYLAKKFGLMGSNPTEEFIIDELNELFSELNKFLIPIVFEKDESKKKPAMEKFLKENFPIYLDFIEKKLKENNGGKGFYVGKSITLADVSFYAYLCTMKKWFGNYGLSPLEGRPLLDAFYDRVESYPSIAAWVKVRPDSLF